MAMSVANVPKINFVSQELQEAFKKRPTPNVKKVKSERTLQKD
jgi:hypothetical protein